MKKWIILACVALTGSLSAETQVLAFAGSTREGSQNKMLVKEAADIARQMGAKVTLIDLRDYAMPIYSSDLETSQGMPENAKKLRQLMINSNAIIIASPEYNGSIPGLLKNAIDWASRNENKGSSRDAFKGKKFAIMSASPGKSGGKNGLNHLRDILTAIGGEVISKQVSVPESFNAFNGQGMLQNDSLQNELKEEIKQLLQ
jgi:chromate reductase, NAD(P)H dehydrogenase (quinone)